MPVGYHDAAAGSCTRIFSVGRFGDGKDGHVRTVAPFLFEFHDTVDKGKKRVVFSYPDVQTRVVDCTALAENDVARFGKLTTIYFNT